MKPIAHIYTNISGKFGIPRQSGVMPNLTGKIIFEPEYRVAEAFRGLEDFSHIWLIWDFSEAHTELPFSPTVRPPRLGGNKRIGVFATRSPFRPNNLGLSVVKLDRIDFVGEPSPDGCGSSGPILYVSGLDLMNGTPIYDIKPYLPYSDSIQNASCGFTSTLSNQALDVDFPDALLKKFPQSCHTEILEILSFDPRPAYQDDPERIYGLTYLEQDIKFKINNGKLSVIDVVD